MKVIEVVAAITNMMCDGYITAAMVDKYVAKHGEANEEQIAAAIAAHPECKSARDIALAMFA